MVWYTLAAMSGVDSTVGIVCLETSKTIAVPALIFP